MVSVIIRNKNEHEFIGFAIQSVIDNLEDFEIIIVDDNSTDDSIEVVKLFSFENIKVIKLDEEYSPGRAINTGVKASSGEIVMILSAHSQIIEKIDEVKLRDSLENHACIFGKQIPVYRGKKINKRYVWSHFIDEDVENMWSDLEKRYFLHNAFSFFRKDFLLENPFDESLSGKEDRYWVNNIIKEGYKTLYMPKYTCYHHWTKNGNTWKGLG